MNTSSQAMADSHVGSAAVTPVDIPLVRRLYWSVTRELWENRSIYLAPLAAAGVFLVGFLLGSSACRPDACSDGACANAAARNHRAAVLVRRLVLMLTEVLVAVFYCVDALYGERRDRSILFWKSLPVSDAMSVLAKASMPILVLPLDCIRAQHRGAVRDAVASSAVACRQRPGRRDGLDPRAVGPDVVDQSDASRPRSRHSGTRHSTRWLLLVSAWAKRVPFLWAAASASGDRHRREMAFNTSYIGTMLRDRMGGRRRGRRAHGDMNMDVLAPPLAQFLTAPGLWIGLAVTALFLYGAVRLRRVRGVI